MIWLSDESADRFAGHQRIAALLVLCRSPRVLLPLLHLAHLHPPIIHNPVLIPIPKHRLTHTLCHSHIGKGHRPPRRVIGN